MGLGPRWHEIARTYGRLNMAVTSSKKHSPYKIVGDMAIFLANHDMDHWSSSAAPVAPRCRNRLIDRSRGSLGEPSARGGMAEEAAGTPCAAPS